MLDKMMEAIERVAAYVFWPMFTLFFLLAAIAAYTFVESI
jgi:hypothetical protein